MLQYHNTIEEYIAFHVNIWREIKKILQGTFLE